MAASNEPKGSAGDRVLDVLEAFTPDSAPQTLDEVRARTGIPRTTTHRILTLLTRRHWLTHTGAGYQLGPRGKVLGSASESHESLRAAAAGPLNELQLATGAVAHLTVLEGAMTCHVDKVGGPTWGEIPSAVGVRLPVTQTAAGYALLAFLPPEEVDAVLTLADSTTATPVDRDAVREALRTARRNGGVVTRDGETIPSRISTAAAPVLGPQGPVAALSVAWRRTGPDAVRAAALVSWAARRVQENLYPEWAGRS